MSAHVPAYMELLDEGVQVWRPIWVESLGSGTYRVIGPVPDGETWASPPGALVSLQWHVFNRSEAGNVAVPESVAE